MVGFVMKKKTLKSSCGSHVCTHLRNQNLLCAMEFCTWTFLLKGYRDYFEEFGTALLSPLQNYMHLRPR